MTTGERMAYLAEHGPRQFRVLSPEQEDAIRAAVVAGAKVPALAKAYGISKRTIYRTLARRHRPTERVQVGPYFALFEISDDGPIQRTEWRAAA